MYWQIINLRPRSKLEVSTVILFKELSQSIPRITPSGSQLLVYASEESDTVSSGPLEYATLPNKLSGTSSSGRSSLELGLQSVMPHCLCPQETESMMVGHQLWHQPGNRGLEIDMQRPFYQAEKGRKSYFATRSGPSPLLSNKI